MHFMLCLLQVVASDNPNTVSYSILSQTPAEDPALFAIDEASGVLSTAVEIDYEALNDSERTISVVVQYVKRVNYRS